MWTELPETEGLAADRPYGGPSADSTELRPSNTGWRGPHLPCLRSGQDGSSLEPPSQPQLGLGLQLQGDLRGQGSGQGWPEGTHFYCHLSPCLGGSTPGWPVFSTPLCKPQPLPGEQMHTPGLPPRLAHPLWVPRRHHTGAEACLPDQEHRARHRKAGHAARERGQLAGAPRGRCSLCVQPGRPRPRHGRSGAWAGQSGDNDSCPC